MAKYSVDVFENWHRKYAVEAENEDEAVAEYVRLRGTDKLNDALVQPAEYIDDAPSDSWIVERVEDE